VLDHLPAKHEAPSSNPNTAKKKKRSIKSKNGNTLNVGKGARKKKETGDQADDKESGHCFQHSCAPPSQAGHNRA
jgi:hypothetical protein